MPNFTYTTGTTLLPDITDNNGNIIGEVSYNGCTFSPLFETKVSGNVVKDNARRTVKFVEYTITVDGYVTLLAGDTTIGKSMEVMYNLLTAQGGALTYKGRALDIIVNAQGGGGGRGKGPIGKAHAKIVVVNNNNDVAWGPIPELLEFQPLGAGRSAKVVWRVTVRMLPQSVASTNNSLGLLQMNYETSMSYGEDGFSSFSIRGTIEIPMTRRPAQTTRTVPITADNLRGVLETRILRGIDLSRFRVTKRDFNVSRDKRTMEWDFSAEEKPFMDLPQDCTIAHGSYTIRPAKAGPGLVTWLCSLRATYTVRNDKPRKTAWWAFLSLLRLRILYSELAPLPPPEPDKIKPPGLLAILGGPVGVGRDLRRQIREGDKKFDDSQRKALLMDFSVDEGLYLDSKTVSFSATWRLNCMFSHILIASGLWRRPVHGGPGKDNLWAASMKDIMGTQSWLPNKLDPSLDLIVDFGTTEA